MAYAGWGGSNPTAGVRTAYSGWGQDPYQESWKSIRTKRNLERSASALRAAQLQEESANRNLALWQGIADGSTAKQFGKDVLGSVAAVGADVLNVVNPLNKYGITKPISKVNVFGKNYETPTEKERQAKELIRQGEYKKGFGKYGEAGLDVASTIVGPTKLFKFFRPNSLVKNFLEGGTSAGIVGAGYGATGAMQEGKNLEEITKSGLTTGVASFLGGGFLSVLPGAVSSVAKNMKKQGLDGLNPEAAKVLYPDIKIVAKPQEGTVKRVTVPADEPVKITELLERDFKATLTEKRGTYTPEKKQELYKTVIEPKIKAIGDVADDETVVMYSGDGKKGQYVNTDPREVWGYDVDNTFNVAKVKTSSLQKTGDKLKDDVGIRTLGEEIPAAPAKAELVPKRETPPAVKEPAPEAKTGKESAYYKRAKEKIEKELQEDVRYTPTTRKAEAEKAVKLIQDDPEKALRIAKGFEGSNDVTSNSLRIALREKALIDGDKKLAAQLEKITSLESTRAGQEISMLRGALNDNDPMALVRSVIRQRLANAKLPAFDSIKQLSSRIGGKGKSKSAKLDTISDLAEKQQKRIEKKRLNLKEVQSFIDEITCK